MDNHEITVYRVEKKYRIPTWQAAGLYQRLRYVMQEDAHNGNDSYMVRSLYFDTFRNDDYFDKIDGIEDRQKIRLRIYDTEEKQAKLEWKIKHNRAQIKKSLLLPKSEAEALIEGDYEVLKRREEKLAQDLYHTIKMQGYHPVCIVEYQRKALVAKTNDIRVTFDSLVSSNEGNFDLFSNTLQTYPVMSMDTTIVEVKYNGFLLSYIQQILATVDVTEESASKYCMARLYGLN